MDVIFGGIRHVIGESYNLNAPSGAMPDFFV
jgi:hypothetical protein